MIANRISEADIHNANTAFSPSDPRMSSITNYPRVESMSLALPQGNEIEVY